MDEMEERDDYQESPEPKHVYEIGEDMEMQDISESAGPSSEEVEALKTELEEQKKATQEEHDRYLRILAEFQNFRRRHQEDYSRHLELANQDLLLKLLPVIDNFERAANAAEEIHDFDALARGVDLTLKQLREILESEGVTTIDSVGQEFDPNLHDAMMRVETDEYPDNTIVEEFEKGYTHKGSVIRPARVKVAVNG